MENTTNMYIEHLVIGLQFVLILAAVFITFDPSIKDYLMSETALIQTVIIVPTAYSLGVIMDRIYKKTPYITCENIFKKSTEITENDLKYRYCKEKGIDKRLEYNNLTRCNDIETWKNNNHCEDCEFDISSINVWQRTSQGDYYKNTMSRKRIMRATYYNSCLSIPVMIGWGIRFQSRRPLIIVMGICFFIIAFLTRKAYMTLLTQYYQKQKKYTKELINKELKGEAK